MDEEREIEKGKKEKKNNEVRNTRETLLQNVRSSVFLLLHSGDLR